MSPALLGLCLVVASGCRNPPDPADAEALAMGRAVMAVRAILDAPDLPPATRAARIADQAGTHETYRVVRAMLVQEIGILEHLLRDTRPEPERRKHLQDRLDGLRAGLRRIDLE